MNLDDMAKKLRTIIKYGRVYRDHIFAIDLLPEAEDSPVTYHIMLDCDTHALRVRQINEVRISSSDQVSMRVIDRKEWQKNPLIVNRIEQIRKEAELN
jgi:hypothetical protein